MSEARGFEVQLSNPLPEGRGTLLPGDLPYVRLFPESAGRLPPGAWRFYNAQGALGASWAWIVLLCGVAGAVFGLVYGLSDRGHDPGVWQITAVAAAVAATGGGAVYASVRQLRRLARDALVVPARVESVPKALPGADADVRLVFCLFGSQHSVTLGVQGKHLRALEPGGETYLIVVPALPTIRCYYEPDAAANAVHVALRAAEASGRGSMPAAAQPADSARDLEHAEGAIVGPQIDSVDDPPIVLQFSATPAELQEAAVAFARPEAPPAKPRRLADAALGWVLFIALAAIMVFVARSRRTGGPGEAGPRWPLRDSPLALAAGLGAAGLGVALFAGGVWWSRRRSLPRDARPILCRVSQAGLSYQTPSVDQVVRWEAYERFVETPNLFVVGRPGGEFRLLPKRAFPDNEVRRRFTLLLSRKLPTVRNVV